ncbi:MAG: alpha/beta hydrolase [Symploca sp. SIO2E9]|nr:alpha/beta hydrolase [Symploca sp. SIO2E9]
MSKFHNFIQPFKPYLPGLFPEPPTKPNYPNETFQYDTQAWGSHKDGNYVMAYIPKREIPDIPQVIIYLHGFAFGNPYYYDAHMQHLAKQGYYVFFADYQKDKYTDSQTPQPPRFGNSLKLLDAAIESLHTAGKDMITTAHESVSKALQEVLPDKPTLDIFLFGHSLGGLFALSWPFFNGTNQIKAIISADPLPNTAELPSWIQDNINSDLPFLKYPVKIEETGAALTNIPVAILLGNKDLFVKLKTWEQYWNDIAAFQKKIYISQTDYYYNIYRFDPQSALIAYHNQSVTNELLADVDENIQLLIGGAGKQDNMRWRFVWDALDKVLAGSSVEQLTFKMSSWSNGKAVQGVQSWPN